MIVDHVAWLIFDQPIQLSSIRFATRLSMPLFCVITGYLLAGRQSVHWERVLQIAIAAGVVNLFYFTLYDQLEILASLLVCYLVYALTGNRFWIVLPVFLLFPQDPSAARFDFPLSVVATCVASGVLLRAYRWKVACVTTVTVAVISLACWLQPSESLWNSTSTVYVLWFLPAAVGLVAIAERWPTLRLSWLEWIGLHPLSIYVTQYVVLLMLSQPLPYSVPVSKL